MTHRSTSLCFVANTRQFESLRKSGALDRWTLCSGDFDVLYECGRRGLPCVDLWSFVTPAEWGRLQDDAWALCLELGREASGHWMAGEGCDLVREACRDLFWSLSALLVCDFTISRALERMLPTEGAHFEEIARGDFFDMPGEPADLFNAAAAWALERAKIPILVLRSLASDAPTEGFGVASAAETGDDRLIAPLPECASLVSISEQLGVAERQVLLERVAESATDWVSISSSRAPSPVHHLSLQALRWLPFKNDIPYREVADFLTRKGRELVTAQQGRWRSVLSNPRIGFLWDGFAERLSTCAREYGVAVLVSRALRPRRALLGYDVMGPARCMAAGFLTEGCSVYAIDHVGLGVPMSSRWHEGARVHAAVWGDIDARGRRLYRAEGAKVEAVGSLRKDHAELFASSRAPSPRRSPGVRVVFITSHTCRGHRMSAWAKPLDVIQSWYRVMSLLDAHPEWTFEIKPHPRYDHPAFYRSLEERWTGRLKVRSESIGEVVESATAMVLMNTPSTAIVDVLARKVPAFYLRDAVFPDYLSAIERDIAKVCYTVQDLEESIRLVAADPAEAETLVQKQADALRAGLAATGDEAARRMLAFMEIDPGVRPDERGGVGEVGPLDRWVVEMVHLITSAQSGLVSIAEIDRDLRSLRRRRPTRSDATRSPLRMDQVGSALLTVLTWREWDHRFDGSRTTLLLDLVHAMPSFMRPKTLDMRAHMLEALKADDRRVNAFDTTPGVSRRLASLVLGVHT